MPDLPPGSSSEMSLLQDWPEIIRRVRAKTPARVLVGRAGAAYRTATQMELRLAHAAARDSVRAEFDMETAFTKEFVAQTNLFQVQTQAGSKDEYLLRPDLGRKFGADARSKILKRCPTGVRLQVAVGDGLSVTAVSTQVSTLLPLLIKGAVAQGWSLGQPFAIRYCRVGILNDIGELLSPEVTVLLIGERPGLATSDSLSAYLAYRPHPLHTDANRNLISNIHARGVTPQTAADRILNLARQMIASQTSGFALKENLSALSK
jgi:ethanolamine ammonia-lyase small subunit